MSLKDLSIKKETLTDKSEVFGVEYFGFVNGFNLNHRIKFHCVDRGLTQSHQQVVQRHQTGDKKMTITEAQTTDQEWEAHIDGIVQGCIAQLFEPKGFWNHHAISVERIRATVNSIKGVEFTEERIQRALTALARKGLLRRRIGQRGIRLYESCNCV